MDATTKHVQAAQHYATLSPDRDAARWMAVAQLLQGNFAEALSASAISVFR